MLDILARLLMGVLQFYAWTVGLGLMVLAVIMLLEGAVDLVRDRRRWQLSRSSTRRINA
jgi:cytochrome c biogenesis protein CcdA